MQEERTAQKKAAKRQEFGLKAIVDVWRLPHFGRIKEGIPDIHLKAFDKMQMFCFDISL